MTIVINKNIYNQSRGVKKAYDSIFDYIPKLVPLEDVSVNLDLSFVHKTKDENSKRLVDNFLKAYYELIASAVRLDKF